MGNQRIWEYKKVETSGSFFGAEKDDLNRYGKEGWELVTVVYEKGSEGLVKLYFKREKK